MEEIIQLKKKIKDISIFENPEQFQDLIWNYLKPKDGPAPRAHLFTINGLTYPIHKYYNFSAVPDSPKKHNRKYSLLAYLHQIRKGDLIFFYQADPQWPVDIENRRGMRGIWYVTSEPFRDTTNIILPTGYEILGSCPNCGTPLGMGEGPFIIEDKSKTCEECKNELGKVELKSANGSVKEFSKAIYSARYLIEPLIIFKRTVPDGRIYNDMSVKPFLWTSRTDNAMGQGKRSSIRTFLPEEAAKIAYILTTVENQETDTLIHSMDYPGKIDQSIMDSNSVQISNFLIKKGTTGKDIWSVAYEMLINLYFSLNIDNPDHPLTEILEIPNEKIDYWTSESDWGYTGGTADFLLSCWGKENGRYKIYLFEFKKDRINLDALSKILIYIPWVAQVLTQFRDETHEIELIPVLVGRKCTLKYLPSCYNIKLVFFSTTDKNLKVQSPIVLNYIPQNVFSVKNDNYAKNLIFTREDLPIIDIEPPPLTYTSTYIELKEYKKKLKEYE